MVTRTLFCSFNLRELILLITSCNNGTNPAACGNRVDGVFRYFGVADSMYEYDFISYQNPGRDFSINVSTTEFIPQFSNVYIWGFKDF
ncbi:hypothetical protein DSM107003_35240 [Trichormus variabilis SAG 1403-4b]|uniref:Uncharacterized protein n=1 Tax=Trichormus variabilis SAG 1403-4b TaxID=447716 RepID=A0A3S1C0J8_ANAVA|nr:hypothetical protein DSM107003_35240 [Trichormus variabilis SAG 1403-4b]